MRITDSISEGGPPMDYVRLFKFAHFGGKRKEIVGWEESRKLSSIS